MSDCLDKTTLADMFTQKAQDLDEALTMALNEKGRLKL
jgi:hypothetical protein